MNEMDSSAAAPLNSLALRLALMRELSQSLAQSQDALLCSSPVVFESQIMRQTELCSQLASIANPARDASSELAQATAALRHQTQVYAALLRRMRRTVEIFCRVLACSGATYSVPSPEQPAGNCGS